MRSLALGLLAAILIAGCGGGTETAVEVNSGEPPGISPGRQQALLARQIEKRNDPASLACSPAESATDLDLWGCKITPTGDSGQTAEVEVLLAGPNGQYEITECRWGPGRHSDGLRRVCQEIH
jgi:hypothetical protein